MEVNKQGIRQFLHDQITDSKRSNLKYFRRIELALLGLIEASSETQSKVQQLDREIHTLYIIGLMLFFLNIAIFVSMLVIVALYI